MSEFKQKIEKMVTTCIESKATTFNGIIVDYDKNTRTCTVEIANPTGAGHIKLYNRATPEPPKGIIPGNIRVGSTAVMTCPQGQYMYAEITSIKPTGGFYGLPERVVQDQLPRTGYTLSLFKRLS